MSHTSKESLETLPSSASVMTYAFWTKVSLATTASGISARLRAQTTANPINRIGTSMEDGWREV